MARRRLDTGPFQKVKQAVAPQPDRDFPQATQPQTTARLNTPKVIPGVFEPTGPAGIQPPAQAPGMGQGNVQGNVRPQQGYNFDQLWDKYQNRLNNGRGGQQFLQNHPRFAQNITRNFQQAPQQQGRPTAPMGPGTQLPQQPAYTGQYQVAPGPGNYQGIERTPGTPGAPGVVTTSGGIPVYTSPPPGSGVHPDGRIDLPTGWAGIGGPNGELVYVQNWNGLTYQQQLQLLSEIKGQDWITPSGGQLVDYGPGITATGDTRYGDMGGAVAASGQVPIQPDVGEVIAPTPPGFENVPMPGYQRLPGEGQPQFPQQQFVVNPAPSGQMFAQPGQQGSIDITEAGAVTPFRSTITGGVGGSLPGPGGDQRPGGPAGGGTGLPGGGGQGGGQAPAPTPTPNPGASTLTLSPAAEQARRGLEDELAATLAAIGVARAEIPATLNLITARLMNDQSEDLRNTDESANARGIYNSGIRKTDRGRVTQGYDRKRSDLAADAARQLADLAAAESGAYAGFNRGWADVLLELARAAAGDPNYGSGSSTGDTYKPGPSQGKGPKPKPQGKNKRNNDRNKRKRGNR